MSKIKQLIQSYSNFIAIPWRSDSAAAQRVIFCELNNLFNRTAILSQFHGEVILQRLSASFSVCTTKLMNFRFGPKSMNLSLRPGSQSMNGPSSTLQILLPIG